MRERTLRGELEGPTDPDQRRGSITLVEGVRQRSFHSLFMARLVYQRGP